MIGKTVSHYEITEELGRGGMGVVYKARDLDLDRSVAIKFLPQHLVSDEEATKRFTHEAKTASTLNHPNIGVVHEIGRTNDGQTFMVMALYEGESLRERIDKAGMSVEEALDIISQVASGLSKAHGRGIVHRDMKPSNILLTEDGHAVIIDFGLAKLAGRTKLTREGSTLGTAAYMSPEQALGQEVDHRSDIFSLGVMLYEMLSGERPFKGEHEAALLYEIVHEDPQPIQSFGKDMPADAQRVIERALAKDRGKRYESSADMLADIKALREGSRISEIERKVGRKTHWKSLLYALCGVVAVAAVYLVFKWLLPLGADDAVQVEPTVVAVLPFEVRGGSELEDLGEGMVDLLSTKLDGAGELRTVDQRALISHVRSLGKNSPDSEVRRAAAERFGAGLYLMGDIMAVGDQVHINASLYEDERGDSAIAEATVKGKKDDVLELADDISIQLLIGRLKSIHTFPYDIDALDTKSFDALKAYLEGEKMFRDRNLGGALNAFQAAVEKDSTFAHAWYRLAATVWWPMMNVERARDAIDKAIELRDALPERERLRIEALQADLYEDAEEAEQIYRTLVSNYPEDIEAWHSLGALLLFSAPRRGLSLSGARAALERALVLDPEEWQSLYHLAAIAAFEHKHEENRSLLARLADEDGLSLTSRSHLAFSSENRTQQEAVMSEMREAGDHGLMICVIRIVCWTDDLDRSKDAVRLISDSERSDEMRGLGHILLGHIEAAKGRWRAAKEEFAIAKRLNPALAKEYEALIASMPFIHVPESDLRTIESDLFAWDADAVPESVGSMPWLTVHDELHSHLRLYLLGLINIRLGDHEDAIDYIRQMEQLDGPRRVTDLIMDLAHGLRAQLIWKQGDQPGALEEFQKAKINSPSRYRLYSQFYKQAHERYLRAELLHELGRHEEALGWTSTFGVGWNFNFIYWAPIHLREAEYYESLEQYDKAIEHYSRFVEIWNDCDEELRPQVDEARKKMEALKEPT